MSTLGPAPTGSADPATPPPRPWWRRWLRAALTAPLAIVVSAWYLFDAALGPIARPLIALFARLRLMERVERLVERLSPYQALACLAVPVAILEPAKLVALYWTGTGHPRSGGLALIGAQLLSILVTERLFAASRGKLLQIGWFAAAYGRVTTIRDGVLAVVYRSAAWRLGRRIGRRAREIARRIVGAIRRALAA